MSTVSTGGAAEEIAADYMQARGYTIRMRNYRRHCEIDIIAEKNNVIYFVEVKYRSSDTFGGGLDYIAAGKLHRMRRAAETWLAEYNWQGECQLSAIAVSGISFEVTDFIQDICI